MQFSTILFAAAAFTGLAQAVQFTNLVLNNVTAGEPFTLTWSNATGPVTITLKNGPALALKDVQTVISGATGSSYTWDVPASLPQDTYAFEIKDSTAKPNYSIQFELIDGAKPTSTSTGTASATASSSTTATPASNVTMTRSTSTRTTATRTPTGGATDSTTSPTSAPNVPGLAAGMTSNLAFVFLAIGALMTLN